jgi:hypothetical protein
MFASVAAFGHGIVDGVKPEIGKALGNYKPSGWADYFKAKHRGSMFKGGKLYAYAEFKADSKLWKRAWQNIVSIRVETDGTVKILWRDVGFNNTEEVVEIDLSKDVCRHCIEMQTAKKDGP